MKTLLNSIVFATSLLVAVQTWAQPSLQLSLVDAYQLALQHDAQIAAARSERDAGIENKYQGRAALMPTLSLGADYYKNNQQIEHKQLTTGITSLQQDLRYESSSISLDLVQPLFRLQNLAAYRKGQSQALLAEENLILAEHDLILRVSDAYFSVLIAEESLLAAQSQVSATERSMQEAKLKYDIGTVTITDVDDAKAGYDLAYANQLVAQNELELARQSLKKIIGQPADKLAAVGDLQTAPLQPADMQQWEQQAMQYSIQIRVGQQNLQVAKQDLASVRGDRYPVVDLVASYSDASSDGDGLSGTGNDTRTGIVGVRMEIPLYTGGENRSKMRQAIANQEKARQNLREVRNQVALDARQAYLSVSSGYQQVKAYRQAVISGESSLKTTQRGYEVGLRTSLDVLNAQQNLYENRRNLANAKYTYLNNLLKLKAVVGVLAANDVNDVNRLLTQ